MARVGIITGSGTYALPDFADREAPDLETPFGPTLVTEGRWAERTVLHVSRHGEGHARLSNHVNHRANVWALRELGADCVIACTACGALHPEQPLGGLIVFDELHFLGNRLADGSLCTLFTKPGDSQRGHWIIGPPYSESLREALVAAAAEASVPARGGGCYGHVDGPRFNTRTEIRGLRAAAGGAAGAGRAVGCRGRARRGLRYLHSPRCAGRGGRAGARGYGPVRAGGGRSRRASRRGHGARVRPERRPAAHRRYRPRHPGSAARRRRARRPGGRDRRDLRPRLRRRLLPHRPRREPPRGVRAADRRVGRTPRARALAARGGRGRAVAGH